MTNQTRQAIRASFVKLLNDRPLSKITVRDITEACGINRNSFYYHYADIPTLIQEIFADELGRIIREYPSIDSLQTCISVAAAFALENKRFILHIYNSVNRDLFEQYLWQSCEQMVHVYFSTVYPEVHLSPEDRDIMLYFFTCNVFGIVSGWLHSGLRRDMSGFVARLCELAHGMIDELLRRCEQTGDAPGLPPSPVGKAP